MKSYLLAAILALLALRGGSPAMAGDRDEDNDDGDKPVAVADLPKAVVDSAATAQSGGKITEAELEDEDGVAVYDLNVVSNGKTYEVKIDASGKVVSNKLDDDDNDDEDDDDGPAMAK